MSKPNKSKCHKFKRGQDHYFHFGSEFTSKEECEIQNGETALVNIYGKYFGNDFIDVTFQLESANGKVRCEAQEDENETDQMSRTLPPAEIGKPTKFSEFFKVYNTDNQPSAQSGSAIIVSMLYRPTINQANKNTAYLSLNVELVSEENVKASVE